VFIKVLLLIDLPEIINSNLDCLIELK